MPDPASILALLTSKREAARVSEIAEFFIEEAGGPQSMARMLYVEYTAAPVGSVTRQKILATVLSLQKERDEARPDADLGLMEDDQIREQMLRIMVDKMGYVPQAQPNAATQVQQPAAGPVPAAPAAP